MTRIGPGTATRPETALRTASPSISAGTSVPALVGAVVRDRPQDCAVRAPGAIPGAQELTYRQLWSRSGRLAARLARLGVRRGEVVAIAEGRSPALVVAMLGIARAGAAYLPLDPGVPAARTAAMLEDSGVRIVAASRGSASSAPWRDVVALGTPATVPDDDGPDDDGPDDGPDNGAYGDVAVGGEDALYVNYTSGSTGRPKGVLVPHRAVVRLVTRPTFCSIAPGDRVAHTANPAFDATTFEVWNPLTCGGTVVVLPSVVELRLDDWLALVRSERISAMFLTTSLFHLIARERPGGLAGLGTVVVGGEAMDLAATRRVLAEGAPRRLVNGYGPTETTTFATSYDCTPESLAGLDRVPVGFALQETRLHVVDEALRPVPPGTTGELCVGGPGVALGYLGRPDLTAERFVPETGRPDAVMYRTGDLARQLPGGALELLGRRDRQVKVRGFRIEPEEVERALTATGLVDAAFVEKVGEGGSAVLAGFVLPARDAPPASTPGTLPERLVEAVAGRMPEYMVPRRWSVLPELPLGPNGKVDRARLIAGLIAGPDNAVPAAPPRSDVSDPAPTPPTSLERRVGQIWADVLGIDHPEPADNFLDIGGNSILAIQLASRLRDRLSVDLEPVDILLSDSLGGLTRRVLTAVAAGAAPAPGPDLPVQTSKET